MTSDVLEQALDNYVTRLQRAEQVLDVNDTVRRQHFRYWLEEAHASTRAVESALWLMGAFTENVFFQNTAAGLLADASQAAKMGETACARDYLRAAESLAKWVRNTVSRRVTIQFAAAEQRVMV